MRGCVLEIQIFFNATPTQDGRVVARHWMSPLFTGIFGWPSIVYSDNGSHFRNMGCKIMFDNHGSSQQTSAPSQPRSTPVTINRPTTGPGFRSGVITTVSQNFQSSALASITTRLPGAFPITPGNPSFTRFRDNSGSSTLSSSSNESYGTLRI